jgi:hypothetical protein
MATGSDPSDSDEPKEPEDPKEPKEPKGPAESNEPEEPKDSAEPHEPEDKAIDELLRDIVELDLQEIDFEALREAEQVQTRWILEHLQGKTIKRAYIEERRIVIETDDGNRYFFYGFMGSGGPPR